MQNRKGSAIIWSHVLLYSFSGVIVLLEKAALALCFTHYLWMGEELLAWLTLALCLPVTLVQLLSLKWYITDVERSKPSLLLLHCLHLGIYHRLWCCMKSQGGQVKFGALLMQQADVSALLLIEALTLSLPQSLLQTYSFFTLHPGFLSPVVLCVGLSMLNVSWFLVLYSRSCFLLRPGHLHMTPAAMLCQLIWRGGMLGARVASLMFFCSMFHWWSCGVVGFHWLIMTFWQVSQQTDICINRASWRLFNLIFGAIHIFFFLNVKDGPSRYRMTGFYLLMLLENTFLLLLASDSLSGISWDSLSVPLNVLCSFLIGVIFVVLYYRFLHPKSTEILQSLRLQMSLTTIDRTTDMDCKDTTLESSTHHHGTFSVTGFAPDTQAGGGSSVQPLEGDWYHHHMLIRLALKTGNTVKISCMYGDRGLSVILDNDDAPNIDSGGDACNQPNMEAGEQSKSSPAENCERLSVAEVRQQSLEKGAAYNTCPVDCSSTVYFSAEPLSSYSVSDATLDKESLAVISPIMNGAALHLSAKQLLNRNPCYTSTPIPDLKTMQNTSPRLGGARRQVHF
ncbi:XK-related protein 5b [Carassius carassius]|uniref:XK-related protein 5b n=1 Tax=Carassius carassius TaxID=217509 RepID=UPI002868F3C2|nr:XK-related protein 5b [Carassius carassius]